MGVARRAERVKTPTQLRNGLGNAKSCFAALPWGTTRGRPEGEGDPVRAALDRVAGIPLEDAGVEVVGHLHRILQRTVQHDVGLFRRLVGA